MGGYGSVRQFYYRAKATTSNYLNIDIRRWKREGLLTPNNFFARQWQCDREVIASIQVDVASDLSYVTLRCRNKEHGQDWKNFNYQVPIMWIECNLGGRRPWFMCPIRGCGRRVALLYGGSVLPVVIVIILLINVSVRTQVIAHRGKLKKYVTN